MGSLTQKDIERVNQLFSEMEYQSARRKIASKQNLASFLENTLNSIYKKVKNSIDSIWNWLKGKGIF